MEASVDPPSRGPDWKPITPKTGSLLHAETHLSRRLGYGECGDSPDRERSCAQAPSRTSLLSIKCWPILLRSYLQLCIPLHCRCLSACLRMSNRMLRPMANGAKAPRGDWHRSGQNCGSGTGSNRELIKLRSRKLPTSEQALSGIEFVPPAGKDSTDMAARSSHGVRPSFNH